LVEREPSKLGVAGSSPVSRSNPNLIRPNLFGWRFAHVAQSVEHFLGKEEVAGSIPAVGFETSASAHQSGREGIENSHGSNQGIDRISVRRLQAAQLYDHPEQEEAD
jgi:hypothetical protein